nr:hypothetical protein [Tanacetum cinerariifolium]
MKVEESLNVTFDETPPPLKTSPLEDDELFKEEVIEVVIAAKLPILNPNVFNLWKMRIEQYFFAPTTTEQRLAKKNKLKARGTLLMAHPDKHKLKFNIHKNAKSLMEAIEKRFGVEKVNGDIQLQALIDDKKVVVTKVIVRRDLHLDDADGVKCLPNAEIFEELARMGYEKPPPKLTFYKAFFSAQWNSMASTVICLATGRKFNFSKYIFDSMVRNVDSPSKFLMYPRFIQVVLDHQVDDMTTHNTRYKSLALTQKVFANMMRVGKGFSGVKTPLFDSMLVQSQQQAEEDVKVLITHAKPSTTREKIEAIDADEGITLVDVESDEEEVAFDAESQGRTNLKDDIEELFDQENVNAASKGVSNVSAPDLVSTAEPTVFDDEDVTMTMAQTLIKLKAEKARILDEKIAQKLHDEETDSVKIYQDLKKKPVLVAQAKKNMMIYLRNMAGYKMKFFKGMTYDEIRPIFEREYNKVQALFKKDKDVQETKKKRVANETLL